MGSANNAWAGDLILNGEKRKLEDIYVAYFTVAIQKALVLSIVIYSCIVSLDSYIGIAPKFVFSFCPTNSEEAGHGFAFSAII